MRNKLIIVFTLSLLLVACTNEADVNEQSEDSTLQGIEVSGNEAAGSFQTVFPELSNFYDQSDNSFEYTQFNNEGTRNSMDSVKEYAIVKEQLKPYAYLLIYNNDSSQAIDLYSYNYIETKKGNNRNWEQGEADTEVALIDFKKNTRRRLYFSGPSYAVLDAKWIGDDSIALATAEIISDQKCKPSFIKLYLKEKQQEIIEYRDTLQLDINNYVEKKMNRVRTTPAF